MSIKPVFFADRREIKQVWQKGRGKIDVSASQVEDMDTMLYAIPDTHRVVSVELLRKAMSEDLSIPGLYDEMRAIIEDKP